MAKEPTLDPVIAHRSRRIASLLVGGEGHRHGLKSKGVWGREQKEIHVRGVDKGEEKEVERETTGNGDVVRAGEEEIKREQRCGKFLFIEGVGEER